MINDSPHQRQVIDTLGFPTSYYVAGDPKQPTMVLLHGMSASADSYREIMEILAPEFYMLAPDIPGFGYSGDIEPYTVPHLVKWLSAFFEAVAADDAILVGHSFGGALNVSFALEQPQRVKCLILLAPSILRPGKFPEWLRNLGKLDLAQKVLELGVSASQLMPERQNRAAFYRPEHFGEELWQRRAKDYRRSRASAAVLRASALHDMRGDLKHVTQPTCIVWGENDPVLDPADAVRLDTFMPQSNTNLYILPECGHLPHIEQQERVVAIIRECISAGKA